MFPLWNCQNTIVKQKERQSKILCLSLWTTWVAHLFMAQSLPKYVWRLVLPQNRTNVACCQSVIRRKWRSRKIVGFCKCHKTSVLGLFVNEPINYKIPVLQFHASVIALYPTNILLRNVEPCLPFEESSYPHNSSEHWKYVCPSWRPLNVNICIQCIVEATKRAMLDCVAAVHIWEGLSTYWVEEPLKPRRSHGAM